MKSVALVGFSESSLDGVYTSRVDEVWTLNNAMSTRKNKLKLPKVTRLFEMHPPGLLKHPLYDPQENGVNTHWEWLVTEEHTFQVVTLCPINGIHNNMVYPFEAIEGHDVVVRDGEGVNYAASTFCYMLALAIWEDYDFIEVWGFDMPTGTEYAYQKPAAEYWLGVAKGKNIKIWLHKKSHLLKSALYGYEASQMISRQMLEGYAEFYHDMRTRSIAKINYLAGKLDTITDSDAKKLVVQDLNKAQGSVYQYDGALQFITTMIAVCDGKDLTKEGLASIGYWSNKKL